MATSAKKGFVPSRHLNAVTGAPRTKLYEADGNRAHTLAVGDPVILTAGFVVRQTNASADSTNFLGVVRAVYDTNKRPLTFSMPTRPPYLNTSVAGWVDVIDDPNMTYIVECATSVGPSNIGGAVYVDATAVNSATGISQYVVTLTSAAGGNAQWRILGLAPTEIASTAAGSGNNRIEVAAVAGLFK